jgi:transcriptional regulator with XRE-family HTH domain
MDKCSLLIKFGKKVREERFKRRLTQQALGDIAGVHRTYIGMVERGEKNLTLTNIQKIAKALKIKPSELLEKL